MYRPRYTYHPVGEVLIFYVFVVGVLLLLLLFMFFVVVFFFGGGGVNLFVWFFCLFVLDFLVCLLLYLSNFGWLVCLFPDHLDHIKSITGPDHIGMGADFDGME